MPNTLQYDLFIFVPRLFLSPSGCSLFVTSPHTHSYVCLYAQYHFGNAPEKQFWTKFLELLAIFFQSYVLPLKEMLIRTWQPKKKKERNWWIKLKFAKNLACERSLQEILELQYINFVFLSWMYTYCHECAHFSVLVV